MFLCPPAPKWLLSLNNNNNISFTKAAAKTKTQKGTRQVLMSNLSHGVAGEAQKCYFAKQWKLYSKSIWFQIDTCPAGGELFKEGHYLNAPERNIRVQQLWLHSHFNSAHVHVRSLIPKTLSTLYFVQIPVWIMTSVLTNCKHWVLKT